MAFALNDINNIDLKTLASAPAPVRFGALGAVFVLVLAVGYWFVWRGQIVAFDAAKNQEMTLRDSFIDKKRQAINLPAYKQQLVEINRSFGALLRQLPNKSEMDALLSDINQAGLGRGLHFDLFKPQAEKLHDFYAELPIDIKVSGSYHDFGAFASDVAQLSRIATLHDINISANKDAKDGKDGELTMNAVVETYRYLDPDELMAQQKAKKPKKEGK